MWSFSFAGSMSSSTAAIGRAVGVGEGVGTRVGGGVVPGLAAKMLGDGLAGEFVRSLHPVRRVARRTGGRPTTAGFVAAVRYLLWGGSGRRRLSGRDF